MNIIAEIGSNWRTSENLDICWSDLLKFLDNLEGLAEFVKFQCWNTEKFVHKDHPSYDRYKYLQFPIDWYDKIITEFKDRSFKFMSTPFDVDTADLLKIVGQKNWKVASGDLTYLKLIKHLASYHDPLYISTGNSNEWEISDAVNAVRYVSLDTPLTLMHCISKYPTCLYDIGFKRLKDMIEIYDTDSIGWSSHLIFDEAKIATTMAATLGVKIYEFHVTNVEKSQEYGFLPSELSTMRKIIYDVSSQIEAEPEIIENTLLWDRRNEKDELRPWIETICKRSV